MIYVYRVDLNERGVFRARVIDEHDNTIYTVSNESPDDPDRDLCFIPQVEDGFMAHAGDVDGLTCYLRDLQVIGRDADIVHECDVPARMARL